MRQAIWSRVGPVTGLLFVIVLHIGFLIHGYPDVRPTDAQLANWLASVDTNRFGLGVYIEALGTLLFIPFAAWLYSHLRRDPRGSPWPAVAMLASATGWVILTLPIDELYVGILGQARRGLDIHVAQTVVSITQATYDMTAIVLGLALLAAGVSILGGGVMSWWAGWAAIVIGLIEVFSAPFGTDATPAGLLPYFWVIAVAGYYTFRPSRARELVTGIAQPSMTPGLPATR
ncbi:MAG: hypothetical protein M3082_15805 [Candidatus Dormibacteraeota bacterium]|nr:hypothetical protein [Candidatus Dormibacteraeota bacterium]